MVNAKGNSFYTISDLASELNVDKRSIRFCEEKRLISPIKKAFNRRIYNEYDRARIDLILRCEASGYSMEQVVDLIGIPDPVLNKADQFREGLAYGEKKLDALIKRSEELSFHLRTSIMTDINLLHDYVKNIQAIKTKILDEVEEDPQIQEKEKFERKIVQKPTETIQPEVEDKPIRQPIRMTPVFVAGTAIVLIIAGYLYYPRGIKEAKTIDLAQRQTVKTETKVVHLNNVPSGIIENQKDLEIVKEATETPLSREMQEPADAEEKPIAEDQSEKEEDIAPATQIQEPADVEKDLIAEDQIKIEEDTTPATEIQKPVVSEKKPITEDQTEKETTIQQPLEDTQTITETSDTAIAEAPETDKKEMPMSQVEQDQETTPPAVTSMVSADTTTTTEMQEPADAEDKPIAEDQSEKEEDIAPVTQMQESADVEKDLIAEDQIKMEEDTTPAPEIQKPIGAEAKLFLASKGNISDFEDQSNRLKSFLHSYCHAYETKDLDTFFAFFTLDATENNKPLNELRPKYEKNMEVIESFKYRIELNDYSLIAETNNTLVHGKFFIRYRLQGGSWKENSGNIILELTEKGDSYLVKRLNYGD